jgi:hypothetical protein
MLDIEELVVAVYGSLEENHGVSSQVIRDNGINYPSEFIRDLEWFNSQLHKSL